MDDFFGIRPKKIPNPGAYPAPPGSGSEGKCGECSNYFSRKYHGKTYPKCGIVQETRGRGTDIRYHAPARRYFKRKIKNASNNS